MAEHLNALLGATKRTRDPEYGREPPEHRGVSHGNQKRILRMADLRNWVGLAPRSIHRLIANGKFPKPFKLVHGGRAAGWPTEVIEAYLAERAKEEPRHD